jgi:hypothetical protein
MFSSYNEFWDKKLNEFIDNNQIQLNDTYTLKVPKGLEIWIAGYPYSYGTIYKSLSGEVKIRPSRLTIVKLRKKQLELIFNNEN